MFLTTIIKTEKHATSHKAMYGHTLPITVAVPDSEKRSYPTLSRSNFPILRA